MDFNLISFYTSDFKSTPRSEKAWHSCYKPSYFTPTPTSFITSSSIPSQSILDDGVISLSYDSTHPYNVEHPLKNASNETIYEFTAEERQKASKQTVTVTTLDDLEKEV